MNILYVVLFVSVAFVLYAAYSLVPSYVIGKGLARTAIPYQNDDHSRTHAILVLGDSTAVGVGASTSEESTAGRVSKARNARIENHAKSGALVEDIENQLHMAREGSYDLILLQVGANNVIYFKSLDAASRSLDTVLLKLKERSSVIVLLTAGDIGKATLWPWPLSWLYTKRTQYLRKKFIDIAGKNGVKYVDLYTLPDPFLTDVPRYYSRDKLHLTGEGYAVWTGYILDILKESR